MAVAAVLSFADECDDDAVADVDEVRVDDDAGVAIVARHGDAPRSTSSSRGRTNATDTTPTSPH